MSVRVLEGDCRELLPTLPDGSVHAVITSPPYFGLRDYGTAQWDGGDPLCPHDNGGRRQVPQTKHPAAAMTITAGGNRGGGRECVRCGAVRVDRQIGLEASPAAFVQTLVDVFALVHRVLRDDGTCWVNIGDSYANDAKWGGVTGGKHAEGLHGAPVGRTRRLTGIPPKSLCLIPQRLAIALQDWGWIVRSVIIWAKPNPMPESVQDRPTTAHEYVLLLSKQADYYYDSLAVAEPVIKGAAGSTFTAGKTGINGLGRVSQAERQETTTRNLRSVWTVATEPYAAAHFATFPQKLIEPCILAGTSAYGACVQCGSPWRRVVETGALVSSGPNGLAEKSRSSNRHSNDAPLELRLKDGYGDLPRRERFERGWEPTCRCDCAETKPCVVMDPFAGSGTTLAVATRHGRDAIGIELNPAYIDLADQRTAGVQMSLESLVL